MGVDLVNFRDIARERRNQWKGDCGDATSALERDGYLACCVEDPGRPAWCETDADCATTTGKHEGTSEGTSEDEKDKDDKDKDEDGKGSDGDSVQSDDEKDGKKDGKKDKGSSSDSEDYEMRDKKSKIKNACRWQEVNEPYGW